MNRIVKYSGFLLFTVVCGYLMPISAQQYIPQQAVPSYMNPPYYSTPSQYYYNQNNPYANSYNYPGFYGGFYGSPPPPTPAQAFPDKAAADNLYRYIQSR